MKYLITLLCTLFLTTVHADDCCDEPKQDCVAMDQDTSMNTDMMENSGDQASNTPESENKSQAVN